MIDIFDLVLRRKAYAHRNKAAIIKGLCEASNMNVGDLAKFLGFTRDYVNNKIHRNSFSIDDLVIAAYASGFKLMLVDDNGEKREIDIYTYFKDEPSIIKRLEKEKGEHFYETTENRL